MHRSSASRLSALVVSVLAFLLLGTSFAFAANKVEKKNAGKYQLKTYFPTKMMVSTPLRDHLRKPTAGSPTAIKEGPDKPPRLTHAPASVARPKDPAVRTTVHTPNMPDPIADFEGQFMTCGCYPPDTNAAVSTANVWQVVNLQSQIYDKDGNAIVDPFDTNSLWTGFGGPCENTNDGDPIVKWDQLAQRWMVSQFAVEQTPSLQCIALSTSPDPLGTYNLFAYDFGPIFNDYPKISIMPDAYYLTVRQFNSASGSAVVAFDRNAMLAGDPPTAIYFDINQIYTSDTFLAADMQGFNPPGEGSPESIMGIGNPDYDGWPSSVLHFVQMTPNFSDPNSTVISNFDLDVDAFEPAFNGVPQGGGFPALEVLPFPMYTPNYRNFGDHDALVFTHDVDAGGGRVGRRWYEVRNPLSDGATIYQQGTFAPDDGLNRWMGSAAFDHVGNIAMGYSVANSSTFPSIWYTGRLASDPLGDMAQGESVIIDGSGWQDGGAARWGDYSSMVTDPDAADDCTFWYTQEYIETTGLATWQTRVGSFKFPNCSIGPTGTLQGTVTDGTNPIAGAKVTAGNASTQTNAAGQYTFQLPVGDYDMTASKYGFLPGAATGVAVIDGGTTNQDFTLAVAPSVNINGVVKDSQTGWPLYAKVTIKASGAPTFNLYTDPVTGYYAQTLVSGISYTFIVNAVPAGYLPGGGSVPLGSTRLAPDATVVNWNLDADPVVCTAPGYAFTTQVGHLFEDFESGHKPTGWTQTNFSNAGLWRFPTSTDECGRDNMTGGTGGFAIADSDCDGLVQDDVALNTPPLDLSAASTAQLQFNSDYFDLGSVADADISTDGVNWTNVWERAGSDDRGPSLQTIDITSLAAGQSRVQARFHFQGFWAWWWEIDNVDLGDPEAPIAPPPSCIAGTGGLVVGNVTSANTGVGLNGATVANMTSGGSVKTFATPDDPNQPDGLYILYSDSGSNDLQASLSLYGSDQHTVVVIPGNTVRQNFVLQSGDVSANPTRFDARVNPGGAQNMQMTLSNTGGAQAGFQILELNAPASTNHTSGFASGKLRQEALARLHDKSQSTARSARGLAPLPNAPRSNRTLAVGDVLASYPSDITYGWGVASSGVNFWLSNLGAAGGDDKDYEYDSTTGAQTGNVQPDSFAGGGNWAADGAFDPITGTFWRVLVGGDNCIYEVNPTSGPTGNKICGSPWANISQRGLAYDIVNNAFFVGGWNEGIVYHIDSSGNVIDSASVGLPISGLAYSAQNGHLLVMSNQAGAPDVTVLDALNNYAVLGTFFIGGSSPVMTAYGQAGMEFDCAGNLWVIDQNTQTVYQVDSGENVACAVDIPWLSENPTEGTLGAGAGHNGASSSQPVALDFEAGTLLPGLRQAQLQVKTDTPVAVPAVPVTLTVRFLDVPDNDQFQAFIYGAAGQGVMFGGTPVCSDELHFCPNGVVTRADMAGYLFRAIHGLNTPPPVYQNIFADVHFNDYNAFYIQGIYNDGITAGCGDGTIYCPNAPNTRAQMSVFIWKGQHGSTPPPACTGVFTDVPCPSLFADYIEGLFNEGVTAGCGNNNFCPNNNITNGQMAVFLVKGFNIPYLP
jgi:hypothetical protein